MRRLPLSLCVLLAALFASPAPSPASPSQVSIVQDDALLFDASTRVQTLDQFASLGAQVVRVVVRWDRIAPDPDSTEPPAFDTADPDAYPPGSFDSLDAIVSEVSTRGMETLLTPTPPGPRWASVGRKSRLWKPDAKAFGRFIQALALRYSGTHSPPSGGDPLPRVSRWSIGNEPNQPSWLRPQFENGRPSSPHRYRLLFRAATAALDRAAHGSDLILLGETAPLGDRGSGSASKMPPGRFLRELFCLGSADRSCRGHFDRLTAGGVAHHPYVKFRNQTPDSRSPVADDFPIGDTPRLFNLLSRAGRAARIRRNIPVYFTEFGWQSSPPDSFFGVPLAIQARYINESEQKAYDWPRLRSTSQYLLRDEPDLAGFQTGLLYENGREKPALDAYRTPLVVRQAGSRAAIWGLVRPLRRSGLTVRLLFAAGTNGRFRSAGTVTTDSRGYFKGRRRFAHGRWRARWRDDGGTAHLSRIAET